MTTNEKNKKAKDVNETVNETAKETVKTEKKPASKKPEHVVLHEKTNKAKADFNEIVNRLKTEKTNLIEHNHLLHEKIKLLEQKVKEQEKEIKNHFDDFQRKALDLQARAQHEITKHKEKHNEKIQDELYLSKKYANEKLIEAIIEPILNIEVAIKYGESDKNDAVKAYVKGFSMLLEQLDNELSEFHITRITPKVDDDFDPNLHHAISTDKDYPNQKIKEVKKVGVMIADRVIKPAIVVIGKK